MSNAVENGELQLMAEYDFNTPIRATIIIYDSDDNSKSSFEKTLNKKESTKNVGKNIAEMCSPRKLTNRKINATSKKRKTSSESKNKKKEKIAKKNTDGIKAQLLFQDKVKQITSYATEKNISHDQTSFREDQSSNSLASTNNLQESNEGHSLAGTQLHITEHQSQDDIIKKANDCIQILLNTVSTHLIFIIKSYAEYITVTKRSSDRYLVEIARKSFQSAKTRFFYLSFSAVANIMLPKENDTVFINNFIDDTVKLANAKKVHCNHSEMFFLCTEMFSWVKSHVQHPLLAELLNKQPQHTEKSINKNSNREQQVCENATCVCRSGFTTGTELTNSTIIQTNQNTVRQLHDSSNPIQSVPSRQSTHQAEMRNDLQSTSSSYVQQLQECYTRYHSINPGFTAKYQSNQPRANSAQVKIHHRPTSPQQKTSRPSSSYHTWQNHTLGTSQNHSEYPLANSAYYDSVQADQRQVEVTRSSVSRDSGFISPLSSVSCDPMCCSPRYDQIDSSSASVTPMITHVTSLNPSVAYIKDGLCHVCGKLTKQKCLGCYKYYYCSIECQNGDWKYHIFICK